MIFKIVKVQSQGFAQLLLNFCRFQPGFAYKNVAYKVFILKELD